MIQTGETYMVCLLDNTKYRGMVMSHHSGWMALMMDDNGTMFIRDDQIRYCVQGGSYSEVVLASTGLGPVFVSVDPDDLVYPDDEDDDDDVA